MTPLMFGVDTGQQKMGYFPDLCRFYIQKSHFVPSPGNFSQASLRRTLLRQVPHSAEKDADGYSLLLEIIKNGEGNPEW